MRGEPSPKRLSVTAESALLAHAWPGNIRELRHAIEREEGDSTLADYLQGCERYFITETLERHGWQIGATARALAISRKNLWERMRRLDIAAREAPENGSH